MQESWTFEFPKSQQTEAGLIDLLRTEEKELGIFLSYYYKKEGAVAEKVRLKGQLEFESKHRGKFHLEFALVHFNACLAIHEQAKEEMEISFQLDPEQEKLILTGAYWPSREMDEI
ncbi:MAG: hypothetical protein LPK25_02020 [Cyclobacteriaceae bacterium]|nr:hypothetical protein [Cyclobacteriaceae bacterium]